MQDPAWARSAALECRRRGARRSSGAMGGDNDEETGGAAASRSRSMKEGRLSTLRGILSREDALADIDS